MSRLLVPFITLGLFVWLAVFAWRTHPPVHHPLSEGEFVAQKLAEYDAGLLYQGRERTVLVWEDSKAALVAEALSLTPDTIDTTVDVRREP